MIVPVNKLNILTFSNVDLSKKNIGIVVSRFNDLITEKLLSSCIKELNSAGIQTENITIIKVPGACEIPFAAKQILKTEKYDGIIAIGAVIRGDTPHFDYVCKMVQEGITSLNLDFDNPVIFGVLTTDSIEQAIIRADENKMNKGASFAKSLLEMLEITY